MQLRRKSSSGRVTIFSILDSPSELWSCSTVSATARTTWCLLLLSPKLQTCTTVSSIWSVTECQLFDVEVMVQLLGNIQTEGGRYCCVWQPEGDAWQVVFCQSDEFKMIWIFFHWCQGGFCGGKGPGWSKVIEKLWYCYQDHDDHDDLMSLIKNAAIFQAPLWFLLRLGWDSR